MVRPIPSWAAVSILTVSALGVVAFLASQTSESAALSAVEKKTVASASPRVGEKKPDPPRPPAIPKNSGSGRRIVYSLASDRIWLTSGGGGEHFVTFTAWPGAVDPKVGKHAVTGRRESTIGSDGIPVVRVVYFSGPGSRPAAFSAAENGASPEPAPGKETSAIRLRAEDSEKLWRFANIGTSVSVVQ